MTRSDILIVMLPHTDGSGAKIRPVVVVSADASLVGSADITIVPLTTNTSKIGRDPTQVLIDVSTPEGKATGAPLNSAVRCDRVTTVARKLVQRKAGRVPPALMSDIEATIKVALDLP